MVPALTTFLHEDKELVEELLPLWVVIQFVELECEEQPSLTNSSVSLNISTGDKRPWRSPSTALLSLSRRRSPRPRRRRLSANMGKCLSLPVGGQKHGRADNREAPKLQ